VNERRLTARTTNNVVHLRPFIDPLAVPTVVLVDLQQEYVAAPRRMAVPDASAALTQCSRLLAHARAMGFPVAFMKRVTHTPFFNAATRFSQWIEGFSPLPTEMVFERELPSCYSNEDFANVMNEGAGVNIVLAGFAGESACLSTAIDAYHRGHRLTFLSDASASHAVETVTASNVHSLVSKVLGPVRDRGDDRRVDRCDQPMADLRRPRARPAEPRGRLMPKQTSAGALCLLSVVERDQ
jgi:nicotinamidase-related amidase